MAVQTPTELAWSTPSTLHQLPIDDKLSLEFDISTLDPAFPSALEDYTIVYSLHLPHQRSTEPVLLLCHRTSLLAQIGRAHV